MKKAIITIQADDNVTLYKAINHLSFEKGIEVLEVIVGKKRYKFNKSNRHVRYFLREDFGRTKK